MGKSKNNLQLIGWMNGKWVLGVATSIGFFLGRSPAGFFT